MPDNDLSVLPAAIANLINLRELDVSKNSKNISITLSLFHNYHSAENYFGLAGSMGLVKL